MVSAEIDFLESDDHIDNVREWEDDTEDVIQRLQLHKHWKDVEDLGTPIAP